LLATGCLISAIAPTFALMFVGRFLCGIGGAVIGATCLAACGDIFPQKDVRNRAIGIVNSAFSLGAIFGLPVVALTADAVDWRLAIALPAPLALLVFLGTGRMPRREIGPPTDSAWNAWRAGYSRVIRSAETMWLLATLVLLMVVWFGWLIYFGAFTEDVYGTTAALLSLMFLVGGGAEMLANNVAPVLIRNRSPKLVACPFALLFAVNLMLVGVALDREWTMFPFIALGSGAGAAVFVCLNIALLDSLPGSEGAAMSLQSAGLELGGAAGVAATGLALALLDDFERVYQLLGVVAPLLIVTIWISSRVRKEPVPGPSLQPAD
jgi:predicted MFS family arabinose efflux permease